MELGWARSRAGTHRSQTHALELQDEHWSEEVDDNGGEELWPPWRNVLQSKRATVS